MRKGILGKLRTRLPTLALVTALLVLAVVGATAAPAAGPPSSAIATLEPVDHSVPVAAQLFSQVALIRNTFNAISSSIDAALPKRSITTNRVVLARALVYRPGTEGK